MQSSSNSMTTFADISSVSSVLAYLPWWGKGNFRNENNSVLEMVPSLGYEDGYMKFLAVINFDHFWLR